MRFNIWKVLLAIIFITWILWFLGFDVREYKPKIIADIKTSATNTLTLNNQQTGVNANNPDKTALSENDILLNKCIESYKKCKNIFETKYQGYNSIKLNENEVFTTVPEAETFWNTWKGYEQSNMKFELFDMGTVKMPICLLAITTTIKNDVGATVNRPDAIACDSNGELFIHSKRLLECG